MLGTTYLIRKIVFESVGLDYLYHVNDFKTKKGLMFLWVSSPPQNYKMKSWVQFLFVAILPSIDTKDTNFISNIWEILKDLDLNFSVQQIRCV